MESIDDFFKEGLGEGPLTLCIYCTKCKAEFELGREAVAMAFIMSTSFKEYLTFVQSSTCNVCGVNDN